MLEFDNDGPVSIQVNVLKCPNRKRFPDLVQVGVPLLVRLEVRPLLLHFRLQETDFASLAFFGLDRHVVSQPSEKFRGCGGGGEVLEHLRHIVRSGLE